MLHSPLKTALAYECFQDQASSTLALPSDHKLKTRGTGKQRVQEQVMMTVKRQKQKSSQSSNLGHSNRERPVNEWAMENELSHPGMSPYSSYCYGSSMYDGLADGINYGTTRGSYYAKVQTGNSNWGYPMYNGTLKRETDNRRFSSYSQMEGWGSRHHSKAVCSPTSPGGNYCLKSSRSEPDLCCEPPRGTLRRNQMGSHAVQKATLNRQSMYSSCSTHHGTARKPIPDRNLSCNKPDAVYAQPVTGGRQDGVYGHSMSSSRICTDELDNVAMTIQKAIQLLCSSDEKSQAMGAYFLQHTCFQDESAKQEVYRLGGIGKLIELLRSPNQNVQQAAAGALRNLVFRNPANKLETRRQNGIRECVSLLRRTPNTEIQKQLTGLLWNLSSTDELKEDLIHEALPVLTDCVIIPFSGWSDGVSNRTREIVDPEVFFNATGCLRNLSSADAGRHTMRNYPGLIDSVMTYTQNCVAASRPDDKIDEYVLPIPDEEYKPRGPSWLYHSDAVRTYLNLMDQSKKDATLEACAGALQNLTASRGLMSNAMSQLIGLKEKGLPRIARLLQSSNSEVVRSGASLLSNMSRHPILHKTMAPQVLPDVSRLLAFQSGNNSNLGDIMSSACYTMRNLIMSNPQMAKPYLTSSMLNNVVNLSRNG
ncbi:Plakophilin-1 [Chelonia mydas]|uniref:Plakophilin-1 n=1 Tax=Chelonia mydas TaxID=8469 RepID=M7CJ21_CHEMY|nr:Plakophilin-1 [Chelonia mydas]